MFKVQKIIFFLFLIFNFKARAQETLTFCNNTPIEQNLSVLFRGRLLLSENKPLEAPEGFTFVSENHQRSPQLEPQLGDFVEFQRKNLDVTFEYATTLLSGEEQKIKAPCFFIQTVTIEREKQPTLIFDWEDLYYKEDSLPRSDITLKRESSLKALCEKIRKHFRFSKERNTPHPELENSKPSHQKDPAPLIRKVYEKTDQDALKGLNYLEKSSLSILKDISARNFHPENPLIPKITHRMWITDSQSPIEPSAEQLEYYIRSLARLNLGQGWTHKFWCWEKAKLPKTCQILENCGQNIEIVEFSRPDLLNKLLASHFIFAALDHGLFTLAGNLLRNNVLLWEGGFYSDLGTEFLHDITPLFYKSDIIAHHRIGRVDKQAWWIDHDFMGSCPKNPIMKEFLQRVSNLHELGNDPEILAFFKEPRLTHSWTNARLLTQLFCLFSENRGLYPMIIPGNEDLMVVHHQSSWYGGDGKSCRDIDKTTLNWFKVTPDYLAVHEALMRDGFNVELYKKYFLPTAYHDRETTHHFLSGERGTQDWEDGSQKKLPIVVTLTSWPGKIRNAHITLTSLLNQSFKPHRIILWLAEEEFPNQKIPSTISSLAARGIEVRWCENLRSAKKLIPALRDPKLSQKVLVVADDDIVYPQNWLESLVKTYNQYPDHIIAHRNRVMLLDETTKKPRAYNRWRLLTDPLRRAQGHILFPTGGGGILFPPDSLDKNVLDTQMFMKLCPTGDDIFWFAMMVLKGTKISVPDFPQTQTVDINDEEAKKVSLWDSTNQHGGNDKMIKAVFEHYGIYPLLEKMTSCS